MELSSLNKQQLEAVCATEGRIRVVAGAGSGKTRALAYRYAYLVNELGISPANILCLTFTNKAAQEMRQRIAKLVPEGNFNDFICTIHAFCVKVLRKEIYRVGYPKSFVVLDEEDAKALAKEVLEDVNEDRTETTVQNFLNEIAQRKADQAYVGQYMLPDSPLVSSVSDNFVRYLEKQKRGFALDFNDIIAFAIYILDRFASAREYWQKELNYIMVDEAQDCSGSDWYITDLLSKRHNNLFIVGDPDQAIYEWRGAKPDLFVSFKSDRDIILNQNYRSTPEILDAANSIIANNKNRIPKDLFTRRPLSTKVVHFHAKNEKEEAEYVARKIVEMAGQGSSLSDFAILFRAAYLSRGLEQELMKCKLDYTMWGGVRFFDRKEIKDVLSYLQLIEFGNDLAFERVVNVPSRKLGKAFLSELRKRASVDGSSLYDTLKRHINDKPLNRPGAHEFVALIENCRSYKMAVGITGLMTYLLDESGLMRLVREDEDEDRLENVEELLQSIMAYEEENKEDDVTLQNYLQDVALYTNLDRKSVGPRIRLMTIHQSKGLEFPHVFITGLNEGIFPSARTVRERRVSGLEEERRLMYVAATRAEKTLILTESEGFNMATKTNKYPSRFIAEIKKGCLVTEGTMDETLWEGTRELMRSLMPEEWTKQALKKGDKVVHKVFGEGTVAAVNLQQDAYEVHFENGDIRNIRGKFLSLC